MRLLGCRAQSMLRSWRFWYVSEPGNPGLANTQTPSLETITEDLQEDEKHSRLKSSSFCPHLTSHVSLRIDKHWFSLTEMLLKRMKLCLPFSSSSVSRIVLWVIHLVEYDHAANIRVHSSIIKNKYGYKARYTWQKCQTNEIPDRTLPYSITLLCFPYVFLILCQFCTGTSLTSVQLMLICSSRQSE